MNSENLLIIISSINNMIDFSFGHFILEFLNTILALIVAGAGFYWFIDKKFSTVFKRMDERNEETKITYVRKDIHDKDMSYLKEATNDKIISAVATLQTELKYINEKLDKLVKHDDARNGIK